uniref:hypothetical protein n=1 Tax=Prevotellamassilia timonensis TaxID=1852370 RepID=UPI00402A395F
MVGKSFGSFQPFLLFNQAGRCNITKYGSDHVVRDNSFLFWSFTKKQYITMLTDRTDCTDSFAHATCFSTTEMTDFTDFVSI